MQSCASVPVKGKRDDPPTGYQDGDGGESNKLEADVSAARYRSSAVDRTLVQRSKRKSRRDASKGETEGQAECECDYCGHELHDSIRRKLRSSPSKTKDPASKNKLLHDRQHVEKKWHCFKPFERPDTTVLECENYGERIDFSEIQVPMPASIRNSDSIFARPKGR